MAYPDGKYFKLPEFGKPDVDRVNRRGDFGLTADRIAYMLVASSARWKGVALMIAATICSDGDSDPWRPATPQSDYAEKRNSTLTRPVYMIEDSVHHFDEVRSPSSLHLMHKVCADYQEMIAISERLVRPLKRT